MQRGESVSYNPKKGQGYNNIESMFPSNKINNLTFKLEQPKIVTIKRWEGGEGEKGRGGEYDLIIFYYLY